MEDSRIIELYFERNEDAIKESDSKYGRLCNSIAYNILSSKEDAEECVNDTWLRSWNSIPPQKPVYLRSFFIRIVRNLAIDRYRKNSKSIVCEQIDELHHITSDNSFDDCTDVEELGKKLTLFLAGISGRDRNIFIARYYYVYSTEDIAKAYCVSANHIRSILSRTRQKLKKYLESEGYTL